MAYDVVVGLGGNCEVAWHWRRWSGIELASPFDWWVTPFEAVPKLFEERFSNLFAEHNMLVVNSGRTVMCKHYGVGHHHDFLRAEDTSIIHRSIPEGCRISRDKYVLLANRMFSRLSSCHRALFIRSWRQTLDPGAANSYAPDDLVRYDFAGFTNSLVRCMPDINFDVLFVNYGTQRSDHPRCRFHNITDYDDAIDWSGTLRGWNEMFDNHYIHI